MAANFSSTENTCQGDNCKAITDVTYYVKEKKRLCKDCASKEGCIGKARKGGPYLYCDKHDEEIKLYCKTDGDAVCNTCAVKDHKSCVLQDIPDAIEEIKANLNGLKGKANEKFKSCQVYGNQIIRCRKDGDVHLQAVKDEVDTTIQEAIKIDPCREQEDAAKINEEIDEKNRKLKEKIEKLQEEIRRMKDEIRENNEEREKRHELNHINAEKRRERTNDIQRHLHMDIQHIAQEIEKKIGELEKSWKNNTKTTEDAIHTLDAVLEDDRNVVKDGHRVNTSVADELKKPLDEGGVTHITQTVSGVRFVKGVGRDKHNGRIDGYDGEWKLIDTIRVRDKITFPRNAGCIDESNVIITDGLIGSRHTYMLDMNTEHTQRVITGSDTSWVISCALLNDDKIVCGKYRESCTGDKFSLTGCISVYDRQWKLTRDVTIPRNRTYNDTRVDVAADQDGMIIAVEARQSKIYVINPSDGKIANTITCKENIFMFDVLSSGHFVARPSPADHRVFIIDREGNESREIPHSDVILNVCIDHMTDDLYVVTSDDDDKTCMIDQVMSGGNTMKRRVASFPLSTRLSKRRNHFIASCVMMTSSGKMVVGDGDNILVFKKMLTF